MTFSVLQSVYKKDSPQFLAKSLRSIAANTVQPVQIVLVKDGALTSELEAVIAEWQEKIPLKVVGYEQNHGLAHALNYGLQFVETELVARMDSDDICFPERFEKQVTAFEIDDSLEILGTGILEFYRDDKLDSEYQKIRLYPKITTLEKNAIYRGTPLAHPTVMMKTALLKKFKYSEKTKCNEDIELWLRLLLAGHTIRTLQEPLLHFRITDGTFNRRSFKKSFDEYKIYSAFLRESGASVRRRIIPLVRLASRLLPKRFNKRLYLSKNRENLFKENLMDIKILGNRVFTKSGHIFEALLEFDDGDTKMIKARQLDTETENVVEVPAESVTLYATGGNSDVKIGV